VWRRFLGGISASQKTDSMNHASWKAKNRGNLNSREKTIMTINLLPDPDDLGPEWYRRLRSRKIGGWATWGGVLDSLAYILMFSAILFGFVLLIWMPSGYGRGWALQTPEIFLICYVLGMTVYFSALLGRFIERRQSNSPYRAGTGLNNGG
jgi:hypothetical protein